MSKYSWIAKCVLFVIPCSFTREGDCKQMWGQAGNFSAKARCFVTFENFSHLLFVVASLIYFLEKPALVGCAFSMR